MNRHLRTLIGLLLLAALVSGWGFFLLTSKRRLSGMHADLVAMQTFWNRYPDRTRRAHQTNPLFRASPIRNADKFSLKPGFTPIVCYVYKRPHYFERVLEALRGLLRVPAPQ